MDLVRKAFLLIWPFVYVEHGEAQHVRVRQEMEDNEHKIGGVARVQNEGGLRVSRNDEIVLTAAPAFNFSRRDYSK